MPDRTPYQGYSILSNAPRATTWNFCAEVSGGTLPAFSRVRKLGRARKSRSFDVPATLPWPLVLCVSFSLLLLSLSALSLSGELCVGVEGAGVAAGGVCCAATGR